MIAGDLVSICFELFLAKVLKKNEPKQAVSATGTKCSGGGRSRHHP